MLDGAWREFVWTTRSGERYHAAADCSALLDGHAKALAEGFANHEPQYRDLADVNPLVTPCAICWPKKDDWGNWRGVEHETIRKRDSDFEIDFLHRVLKKVDGLHPGFVRVQHEVVASDGSHYRIDFALLLPGVMKIAIEVDGHRKSESHSYRSKEYQDSSNKRRNELELSGWCVLNFSNYQARIQPQECQRQIEWAIREKANRSSESVVGEEVLRTAPSEVSPTGASRISAPATTQSSSDRSRWLAIAGGAALVAFLAMDSGDRKTPASERATRSSFPNGNQCPEQSPIKGNINDAGERIYHEPGWEYYSRTRPEACFSDTRAAESAGFRASKVR